MERAMVTSLTLLTLAILCVVAAFRMAVFRGRRTAPWMWAAVFLGPLPLVLLAVLPQRYPAQH